MTIFLNKSKNLLLNFIKSYNNDTEYRFNQ
jgi:hypothetical protein